MFEFGLSRCEPPETVQQTDHVKRSNDAVVVVGGER